MIPYLKARLAVHGIQLLDDAGTSRRPTRRRSVRQDSRPRQQRRGVPMNKAWEIPTKTLTSSRTSTSRAPSTASTPSCRASSSTAKRPRRQHRRPSRACPFRPSRCTTPDEAAVIALMETLPATSWGRTSARPRSARPVEGNLRNTSKEVGAMMGVQRESGSTRRPRPAAAAFPRGQPAHGSRRGRPPRAPRHPPEGSVYSRTLSLRRS